MGALSLNNAATFDAAERLSARTTEEGQFVYTYHAHNGLMATISNVASKVNVRYDYDVMDRITSIVWRDKWGQTERSFTQSYSPDGLITNVAREWSGYDGEYTHDSLGRLTSGQGYAWSGTYAWDAAGNPANSTYGQGNRIYSSRYEHADSGCITEIDLNVPFQDPVDLTWNSQYQLTSIESDGTVLASYEYDALGRRCRAVTESGSVTNVFVYDGAQVVADLDGNGNLLRTYTWAPGIDRLLAMTVHTGATDVTYYALTDHLGSVHAWLNDSGLIVECYEYNAWGKVVRACKGTATPITASTIGNRYLWHGREYEWATHNVLNKRGLYHFRARWYSPYETYGRWLSKDPIGIAGGLNQYEFCGNNPVNYIDPDGMLWRRWASGDEVGFGESLIPIWGSGRSAIHHYGQGHWVRGTAYTALAVTDVFLVKAVVTGVAKVGAKAFASPGVVKVFAGRGALRSSPVHVAWKVGGRTLEAVGPGARITRGTVSGLRQVLKVPVLSTKLAGTYAGGRRLSCVTAALSSISRGWFHLPTYCALHGLAAGADAAVTAYAGSK